MGQVLLIRFVLQPLFRNETVFYKERLRIIDDTFQRQALQILAVDPVQFFDIIYCPFVGHLVHVKLLDRFFLGDNLLIPFRGPA